jgi:ADP-heptose:LPS heptosyltransferase
MTTSGLNVAGKTSLGGLAALISELDLFISNDTGPAHIANAVDTPSITLFGPVDPRRWASRNRVRHPIVRQPVECSPCPYWECPIDHRCMRRITPKMVIAQAEHMLLVGGQGEPIVGGQGEPIVGGQGEPMKGAVNCNA